MYFGAGGDESGETAAFYETVSDLPTNFLTVAQDDTHTPGLELAFEAADGTFYTSKDSNQSGSSLSVAGSTEGMVNGLKTLTVWGSFSCKLYNSDDNTDFIEVTDGTYKLILSEFQ